MADRLRYGQIVDTPKGRGTLAYVDGGDDIRVKINGKEIWLRRSDLTVIADCGDTGDES